ncbi:helix-turn-helix transcriptional regulator [Gracilimonas mengyeensis]|uniref:Transcriptional regulator n=1 Tax=Gracilimonas mengyeensis TaxID=1302730 RepID=A0A521B1B4_9BACT|nr:metalloregulator ArsR/SmtB family transcription factor [Gracilimonas mengyeensis]SMO40815.1 transcriptional regulator [Gracilimonas mengyeensis]
MQTQLAENEKALEILKRGGPKSISGIADSLKITTEGARFHLLKLEKEGLVQSKSVAEGRGRPKQIWSLTQKGHDRFPDAHAKLTANLIQMMRDTLGEEAVDQVISRHEKNMQERYSAEINEYSSLETRIEKLAEIRSREGYMAEYKEEDDAFIFIENHCPICLAAKACQGFCRAELQTFKALLGEDVQVTRVEHLLSDGRRCAYRISEG